MRICPNQPHNEPIGADLNMPNGLAIVGVTQSQQLSRANNGEKLRPRGPPQRLMRGHQTQAASSRPQPGMAGNNSHRALCQHWRRTTHPNKASSSLKPGLAENSTQRALCQERGGTTPPKAAAGPNKEWRGTAHGLSARIDKGLPHQVRQQALARNGSKLHKEGPPPGWVGDQPSHKPPTRNGGGTAENPI